MVLLSMTMTSNEHSKHHVLLFQPNVLKSQNLLKIVYTDQYKFNTTRNHNMPKSPLMQAQRLEKYKISYERFNTEHTNLLAAGFTSEQAESLVIRQSSTYTVAAVINNYKALLQQPYALTHQQIITIAGHDGGSKNIEVVQAAYQPLKDLGFTAEQVVKIAGNIGGSKNIEAVQAAYQPLKDLGFTAEQVVKIVGHGGGSKNIEAVQAAYQPLKDLGFNADQVVKIAGHDGGSKNIEAVKNHYKALIDKGYNKEKLVSMVARNSGSKRIYDIIEQSHSEDNIANFLFFLNNLSLRIRLPHNAI